jgi:transcriptional regulator with XRE-family HTH domain
MDFIEQIRRRQRKLGKTLSEIARIAVIALPNLSTILNGRKDIRSSTLRALADAVNAKWILVPKCLLPEVERLMSGPEQAPSSIERLPDRRDE